MMRRIVQIVGILTLAVCGHVVGADYDWSTNPGDGSPENPFQISEPNHLIAIGSDPNLLDKCFVLMHDIEFDPNDTNHVFSTAVIAAGPNDRKGWYDGPVFDGALNGEGYCIRNLHIDALSSGNDFLGLIAATGPNSVIRSLGIENFRIIGRTSYEYTDTVGALVGINLGRVENCHSIGYAIGWREVGGLVGQNAGDLVACWSIHSLATGTSAGGLVGANWADGRIAECYSLGTVAASDDSWTLGGLAGTNQGIIELSYSSSKVSTEYETDYLGGLVGWNYKGIVSNCYATGEVGGAEWVGGLLGRNEGGRVEYCYSTGRRAGLVGRTSGEEAFNYWDVQSSGVNRGQGGTGLTTAEMMSRETYIFWEQERAWVLDEGNDYPHLIWEGTPGTRIVPVSGGYAGGEGTAESPFLIGTREHLLEMRVHPADWDSHFRMISDINMSPDMPGGVVFPRALVSYNTAPNYLKGYIGVAFGGSFNGGGHTISNLTIDPGETSYCNLGLFGQTTDASVILDLVLDSVSIDGYTGDYVGSVAGDNAGTIFKCRVAGTITGYDYSGGLAGRNSGNICNCSFSGDLTGGDKVGGVTGSNVGEVRQCYVAGNLGGDDYVGGGVGENEGDILRCYSIIDLEAGDYVGGLVGQCTEGTVTGCSATGIVSGRENVGGLVGWNPMGRIRQSYAHCDIEGTRYVGGLAGSHGRWYIVFTGSKYEMRYAGRDIYDSYTEGNIMRTDGTQVGGLAGQLYAGTIGDSFSTVIVQGSQDMGGLIGANVKGVVSSCFYLDTAGVHNGFGTPLTLEDMWIRVSYGGWDFLGETANGRDDIWTIDEGEDYPRFVWQVVRGFAGEDVDFGDYCLLAEHWRDEDCESSDDCSGADIDFSGGIDFTDLRALALHWLSGVE